MAVVFPMVLALVFLNAVLFFGCLSKSLCPPKNVSTKGDKLWLYKDPFILLIYLLNFSFCLDFVLLCLNSLIWLISKLHFELSLSS